MAAQDDINAAVASVTALLSDISAQNVTIGTDLTAIQAQLAAGQPVDTSALDSAVANVQSVQAALDQAVAAVSAVAAPPASA